MKTVGAIAHVHVTVKAVLGPYASDAAIEAVYALARNEAVDAVESALRRGRYALRVVGEPVVEIVINVTEEQP